MTTLSVVVPVYNGRHYLEKSLVPLRAAQERGELVDLVVIDDGSTDGGAELCRAMGVDVIPSAEPRSGPAAARNLGADRAQGDIVLFVDSDVVIREDVPRVVMETFADDANCVAVFGSYDDNPPEVGFASTYANLRHHWIHQQADGPAHTFWAGCGAVRRSEFLAIGGYDRSVYHGRPSIEDIELGMRLDERGTIRLRKDMIGTHLKQWTFGSLVSTDIWQRAIPWSRLLVGQTGDRTDLNLNNAERVKAITACALLLCIVVSPFFPRALIAALVLAVIAWIANAGFFGLIWRRRGPLHALAGFALHQLYYVYSTAAFAYVVISSKLHPRGENHAPSRPMPKP